MIPGAAELWILVIFFLLLLETALPLVLTERRWWRCPVFSTRSAHRAAPLNKTLTQSLLYPICHFIGELPLNYSSSWNWTFCHLWLGLSKTSGPVSKQFVLLLQPDARSKLIILTVTYLIILDSGSCLRRCRLWNPRAALRVLNGGQRGLSENKLSSRSVAGRRLSTIKPAFWMISIFNLVVFSACLSQTGVFFFGEKIQH